jgi:hypothetical protein
MLGTWQETRYTLMTFGLPVDAFPIAHDEDDFSLDNHMDWSRREKLEACLDNTGHNKDEGITEPRPLDVLMCRGGYEAQIHPGNLRFRNFIAESEEGYEKSLIHGKTAIAKEIVRLIKESGGRFLQRDGHGWMLVDDKKARTKVSSAFRDSRRKSRSAMLLPTPTPTPRNQRAPRKHIPSSKKPSSETPVVLQHFSIVSTMRRCLIPATRSASKQILLLRPILIGARTDPRSMFQTSQNYTQPELYLFIPDRPKRLYSTSSSVTNEHVQPAILKWSAVGLVGYFRQRMMQSTNDAFSYYMSLGACLPFHSFGCLCLDSMLVFGS